MSKIGRGGCGRQDGKYAGINKRTGGTMESDYFSLFWDTEENYEEWRRDMEGGEEAYIADLNLRYVYEEICRLGRFGEQYDFEQVFLHPCGRLSTVLWRKGIMERLYENSALYETAEGSAEGVSGHAERGGSGQFHTE